MGKTLDLKIILNKKNKQINLNPVKKDLPKSLVKKINSGEVKFLKFKLEGFS